MKRKFAIVVMLLAVLCFGCANEKNSNNNQSSADEISYSTSSNNSDKNALQETEKNTEEHSTIAVKETERETKMKVNIKVGEYTFIVTLKDNMTAEAFQKLLPLNITMDDVNGNEKYYVLPQKIRKEGSINPGQINAGDIMCYGDQGLVLFYESFPTSYSYVSIGKVDNVNGLKEALGSGNVTVSITILQE